MDKSYKISWLSITPASLQEPIETSELRLSITSITERNLDVGTCDILHFCEDPEADDLIPVNADVSIWEVVGETETRIFRGRAYRGAINDGPEGQVRAITIHGPWQFLRDASYHKGDYSGDVLLNVDFPVTPTMSASWDYLRAYWGEYMSGLMYWPDFEETGLPEIYYYSVQGLGRQQLSSCLASLVSQYPHATLKWDYSTSVPTMVITKRDDNPITLARGSQWTTCGLRPNDVGRPSVVSIREFFPWGYIFPEETEVSEAQRRIVGDFTKSQNWRMYPTGSAKGGPGVLCLFYNTYDVYQIPFGAEQWIYDLLTEVVWEGSLSVHGTNDIHIGDAISITGTHADLATAAIVVQSCRYDLATAMTELTLGVSMAITGETIIERVTNYLRYHTSWTGIVVPPSVTAPE